MGRLNFIRHARELGFEVAAVRELLALSEQPYRPCAEVDSIARRHIADIDRRIAQLSTLCAANCSTRSTPAGMAGLASAG